MEKEQMAKEAKEEMAKEAKETIEQMAKEAKEQMVKEAKEAVEQMEEDMDEEMMMDIDESFDQSTPPMKRAKSVSFANTALVYTIPNLEQLFYTYDKDELMSSYFTSNKELRCMAERNMREVWQERFETSETVIIPPRRSLRHRKKPVRFADEYSKYY